MIHKHLRSFFLLFLLGLGIFAPNQSKATHAAGAELLYEWDAATNMYKIIFKFYRNCGSGVAAEPGTVAVCYYNTCNNDRGTLTLTKAPAPNGQPVSVGCPQYPNKCEAPNDATASPGYQEWYYSAEVTLPSQCNKWIFFTQINARNNNISNLVNPGNQLLYIEATLDNQNADHSSSPYFTVKPVPYVCANMRYAYNNGAVDPNNDSLGFQLIRPRTTSTAQGSCAYPSAASDIAYTSADYNIADNPFSTNHTFTLDPETGQFNFKPDIVQNAVVTLKVTKYRNQVEIGSVMRDIQINVLQCDTTSPRFHLDTPSIAGMVVNNGRLEGCAGTPLSFCFNANINDPAGVLVLTDNHAIIPGSTVTYQNQATNNVTGCFNWTPTAIDTGMRVLAITIKDSTCSVNKKVPISQTYVIPFYVYPTTRILNPDTIICRGDNIQLEAAGGTSFHWSVLPGGSINSLSCEDCRMPFVNPTVTTSYVVVSNNNVRCGNTDTITVRIPGNPFAGPDNDGSLCVGESKQMHIVLPNTPGINYTVQWTPATFLDDPTSTDPISTPTATTTYTVTVTPVNNTVTPAFTMPCTWQQSFTITVLEEVHLTVSNDTLICPDDTAQIHVVSSTNGPVAWYPNLYINDTTSYDPKVSPTAPIYYYVRSLDVNHCQDTQRVQITVKPRAILSLPDSVTIYPGESYHLSPQGNCMYFQWFPLLGLNYPNISDPIAQPDVNTRYFVRGVTEFGCIARDSIDVMVSLESYIDVPNAFTPGNGANNVLRPVHKGRVTLESFQVYNRWGVKVYETSSLESGWDGKLNGETQPMGVYVYIVKARTASGKPFYKQGNVTLLR